MNEAILALLVSNHSGVLSKVTGLFSRRGYNIKSLSVGETQSPNYSRITIVTQGDEAKFEQIYNQVTKLEDVKAAQILPADFTMERELVLIKVLPQNGRTGELLQIVTEFAAKTKATIGGGAIIEATGSTKEIDKLISLLRPLGILELSRTGTTALELKDSVLWADVKTY